MDERDGMGRWVSKMDGRMDGSRCVRYGLCGL